MFYKIISGGCVVDACTHVSYVRWQERHRVFLACDEKDAQGLVASDGSKIYLLDGMPVISGFDYASVVETTEEEYNAIRAEIDAGGVIPSGEDETPDSTPKTLLQQLVEEVSQLREDNAMLTDCVLELSEIIYG